MSRTLQKVVKAGNHNPGCIPTKIYLERGKGSIVALEDAETIAARYEEALGGGAQGPMVKFTDYRGNPSAIRVDLIKGYSSLCSEAEYVAAMMGHQTGSLKVQAVQGALPSGQEGEIIGLLKQLVESTTGKEV